MITLYLNHFRGFEDTFIPLDDVSFLVGENSTGKTSVLTAMRVLCDEGVWLTGRFQVLEEVLGGFNDFASNGDEWFQVGYFHHDPVGKDRYDAALLTFTGRGSNVPRVMDVRLLSSHTEVHFHYEDHEASYYKQDAVRSIEECFRAWSKANPSLSQGSSVLDPTPDLTPFAPRGMIMALDVQESNAYEEQMEALDRALDDRHQALVEGSRPPDPTLPSLPVRPIRPRRLPMLMNCIDDTRWLAPIRAKPQRSYDSVVEAYSPEGDHIPWRLRDLPEDSRLRQDLREYGRRSGLYDDVEARKFGDTEDAPFELRVRFGERAPNLINVGYGVSQVLPVMTTLLDPKLQGAWFALQQPEVHLHPRAQAALGETLFEMALSPHDKRFLVETHSDYVVDRFRYRMRKAYKNKDQALRAQVLFFERIGEKNVVHRLPLAPDGEYPEEQPKTFREFFLEEELKNLGY